LGERHCLPSGPNAPPARVVREQARFAGEIGFHLFSLVSHEVEILVALADGEGSGLGEEFMAEGFCDEDVLGHVLGFKAVVADSGVGASQVAWFPGKGEGAEGVGDVLI
jgi:hypothetical protein